MSESHSLVSIVITTRNRRDDVLRLLDSCYAQSYPAIEILVFDDASSDDTCRAVSRQFPTVQLHRSDSPLGQCALRNRGFEQAMGMHVVLFDDDAYLVDPHTITRAVELLQASDDVAVIALPFAEPGQDKVPGNAAQPLQDLRNFVGCAAILRRDAVLEIGGFREFFVGYVEESDLSLRLMEKGWRIILGDSEPVVHIRSAVRSRSRMERYGIRNTLLMTMLNVPELFVLPRLFADGIRLVLRKPGWPITIKRGYYLALGFGACVSYASFRRPVSRATYQRYCHLPRHGPVPVASNSVFEACSSLS